jgi:hypothetical protein
VCGRHDRIVLLGVAEAASARLGWPLHAIDDTGHAPHIERSAAFLAARTALGAARIGLGRSVIARRVLDCVVVGAGPAGLAASAALTERGIEHEILERGSGDAVPGCSGRWIKVVAGGARSVRNARIGR